jgi:hypothetical protein
MTTDALGSPFLLPKVPGSRPGRSTSHLIWVSIRLIGSSWGAGTLIGRRLSREAASWAYQHEEEPGSCGSESCDSRSRFA